ncbi:uncharacterized protein AUP68_14478 [Ilyonectria robusta]
MAPSEDVTAIRPSHAHSKKRTLETASVSESSTSSDDSSRKKKRRDRKALKKKASESSLAVAVNGARSSAFAKRRNSLGKAARDPRDEPVSRKGQSAANGSFVSSANPVIDDDGLSRPSMTPLVPGDSSLSFVPLKTVANSSRSNPWLT